jgi:hypothetical protein
VATSQGSALPPLPLSAYPSLRCNYNRPPLEGSVIGRHRGFIGGSW